MTLALLRLPNKSLLLIIFPLLAFFTLKNKIKKQSAHVLLTYNGCFVALIGSLAVPFTPHYGGKETLQTNYNPFHCILSISLIKESGFLCLCRDMHIYLHIQASPLCSTITSTIGEARIMTRLSNWYFVSLQSLWLSLQSLQSRLNRSSVFFIFIDRLTLGGDKISTAGQVSAFWKRSLTYTQPLLVRNCA